METPRKEGIQMNESKTAPETQEKKCLILYCSSHHQNTETLVKKAAAQLPDIDVMPLSGDCRPELSRYELIGLASGIYMGRPHAAMQSFLEVHQKELKGRKVFTLLTSGANQKKYGTAFSSLLEGYGCTVLGNYQCKGFDTFGPWKLIGGIAKGHPDNSDIAGAEAFLRGILSKQG